MINHRLRLAGVIISGLLALIITAVDLLFFFRGETVPLPALLLGLCALGILILSLLQVVLILRSHSGRRQKVESQRLDELHSLYTSLHGLRHDLKNHLQVASALIRQGQAQKGSEYLDAIEKDIFSVFSTGCLPLDSELTLKELDMRQKHIRFEHQLCALEAPPISDYELCSIVGNLLDNAIEAHSRYTAAGEYTIVLNIRRVRDMLYIECVNPADPHTLRTSGNRFLSSKAEEGHGLGISSIEAIVSRAQGRASFRCAQGKFSVLLALPYTNA